MASQVRYLVSFGLAAVAVAGCGATAPARFYTLESAAAGTEAAAARYVVVVGPISLPTAVDRPQFVVQVAPNRVEIDEFNRWAAPLDESIARVVADDLATLLGNPDVVVGPAGGIAPAYRVTIEVQRFESVAGKEALVDALWVVRATADGALRSGRTVSREAVSSPGVGEFAAAHSRALARVSNDIATEIRALASRTAAPAAHSGTPKR